VTNRLDVQVAGGLLTALEDLELPLLSWGVTTKALAEDEVLRAIEKYQWGHPEQLPDRTPENVRDQMVKSALLFQVPGSVPFQYRTRLAETLRLTARLRQLFGAKDLEDMPPNWWEAGRTLVADYRLHVAPRRYPQRDIAASDALTELGQLPQWGQVQGVVAAAQVGDWSLARFQVDAAAEIYQSITDNQDHGVIVGAGTGSGKTLAFYLPAFAALAEGLYVGKHQVHTLALYPRKELLRDQLREAVAAALAVAGALRTSGRRSIRIGALYGATPQHNESPQVSGMGTASDDAWPRRGRDVVCPYLPCPQPGCDGDLIWSEADRKKNRERLTCASCGRELAVDVALTRKSLQDRPPDILFTTTEMLSRHATSVTLGRLLGWRSATRPRLVLLDEVHTYSGVHGAQVALLLRRWRRSVKSPVTFVGLSATLKDAKSFFAQLTGLEQADVEYIEPRPEHMVAEGREYALALRGDPVSGTSLLSTSIQTAMLYGRIMDLKQQEYLHGSVGFLFTDDLDVTNRFYDDLCETEGEKGRYRPYRSSKRVLAGLRAPSARYPAERYRDGQSWDLVQRIGRHLDPAAETGELRVGRTSSQDAGVDRDADLIVATASLEVGFNDPRVGLILQHKAPHDPASFIQRRGRAGRLRGTRPWTVVTLSDYGRDRLAYQAYDSLFSPELAAQNLPVGNRSVLKIQGACALLDWLALKLSARGHRGDPREILTRPRNLPLTDEGKTLAKALADVLKDTLQQSELQDDLAQYLRRVLQVKDDEVQALLWEPPRSLLLAVVPTALRRMNSQWQEIRQDPGAGPRDMLPEFITRALFDPLNVPEVIFKLPFAANRDEALPIERSLREAVPGRVSRRYGYQKKHHRTWLALPPDDAGGVIDLGTVTSRYTREGIWTPAGQQPVQVIRPHVINLQAPDDQITDQSQGFPVWGTEIIASAGGLTPARIPAPSAWAGCVTAVGFATHAAGNPAEVRRMTTGATCETSYSDGRTASSTIRYTWNGGPAALGFRLTADGARFDLATLDLDRDGVARHLASPGWRTFAFTTAIREDSRLDGIANTFQRGWLTLAYLTAFALEGIDETQSPEQVHVALADGRWSAQLPDVLRVLYRNDSENGAPATDRLVNTLTELSKDEGVQRSLDEHGQLLWAADAPQRTSALAQRAYRDTVAAALLAAALRACPDSQDRDLIVDVLPPEDGNDSSRIWLTETSTGGLGLIDQLARYYEEDPRRFWGLVDSALGPNDFEYVDATLTRLLRHVTTDPQADAGKTMKRFRSAASVADADQALRALRAAWTQLDGYPRQPAVSALSARLLRPGTTDATDRIALSVINAWDALEAHLRFEVDARVIAFGVGAERIPVAGAGKPPTGDQVFSMLWPRGYQARSQHLAHYQPYAAQALLDRLLIAASHDEGLYHIDITKPDWRAEYTRELASRGAAVLTAPASEAEQLSSALRVVPALPIDRDVLRVYGEIREVTRAGMELRATVDIREAVQ
jgi:ATP-dependent helicase Lhr and Lhr-like helicase